ncbi:MAG TPA: glycosyltransferase family 39 protein [Ferruginibacter sp.]|nr:glycosyltransferase family 39 protein [Ferruginibacter sp.]
MLKKYALLIGIIVLKFIIQFNLVNPAYELQRDEFLHIDQGKHLAAGFISVPPLTALQSWLILKLGNTDFWVRFFPALFGAITIIIVWKAIEELKGGIYALLLGSCCILFSALLRLNILYQPNSFDVMAWTFIYFCIIKFINRENKKWIWLAAMAFAVAFLNKYNIAFQLMGLLPALLICRQRKIFTMPVLYFAMLFAFLLIAPNIYWQYQNGFPVLKHMRELTDTQLVNVKRVDFLKEQLLFFVNGLIVLIAGFFSLWFYQPFKKYRVLFYSFVFTLVIFIALRAKSYYAIGLYPIFIAFGAVWLEIILEKKWKKWAIRPLLIVIPVVIFILILPFAFPIKNPEKIVAESAKNNISHTWEDGKEHPIHQDFADMIGWKELAAIVDSAYQKINDPSQTIVFCDNYGQAGAINYYSKVKNIHALSSNADYATWFPDSLQWKNCIRVKENDKLTREINHFDSCFVSGKIKNKLAREYGTTVFTLLNADDSIKAILQSEIIKAKNKYRN